MRFVTYGIATALMLTIGAFALPGKAEARSGVAIRAPGFSLYLDNGRHYRHRHYSKRHYYRGRHHYGHRHYYKKRYNHRHHRHHHRYWR